jgi:LPS O-antigen subunit length determinant protein (WzzB/FepE family)
MQSKKIDRLGDKIDLFEILYFLWRWKYLILAFIVVFTGYAWTQFDYASNTYAAHAVLKIGSLAGVDIERRKDIEKRIGDKVELEYPHGNLQVMHKSDDPDEAYATVKKISEELVAYHRDVFLKATKEIKAAKNSKTNGINPLLLLETYNYQTEILTPAKKPIKPVKSKIVQKTTITIIMSFIIGAIFSYLIEHFRNKRYLKSHQNPT